MISTPKKIFINYRRSDSGGYTAPLHDRLTTEFGAGLVFRDDTGLRGGNELLPSLYEKLDASAVVLVVIGPRWTEALAQAERRKERDYVRLEIERASTRGKKILTVLVDGANLPPRDSLPKSLWVLFDNVAVEITNANYSRDVDGLIEAIKEEMSNDSAALTLDLDLAPPTGPTPVAQGFFDKGRALRYRPRATKEDYEEAFKAFTHAAQLRFADAKVELGKMYEYGLGRERDLESARKCYEAAKDQSPTARVYLARMYEAGLGVDVDEVKAAEHYLWAADRQDPFAQFKLAEFFESGRGVSVNLREARKWYQRALQGGWTQAEACVERLESDPNGPDGSPPPG